MKKKFRSFEDARTFVRKLNLNGQSDWAKYRKSGKKPLDIPSNPNQPYKNKGWVNWKDFLGTEYLNFKDARTFVIKFKLKSVKEWKEYCKSDNKPYNIPSSPSTVYKNKGWTSWGNFLGTEYLNFKDARTFVIKLNLKGEKEWKEYCKSDNKSDNKPYNIPSSPSTVYKNKGWKGMGDWIGTGSIATTKKDFLSYEDAKKFAISLNLNSLIDWRGLSKSKKLPKDIPSAPHKYYKNKGWINWGDFLGTGNTRKKDFLSFEDARKFVRGLNLDGLEEWKNYRKSGKRPKYIPSVPEITYKKEWISTPDWLGGKKKRFRSFEDARKFVRGLNLKGIYEWQKYCRSGNKPADIPANPSQAYRKKKRK